MSRWFWRARIFVDAALVVSGQLQKPALDEGVRLLGQFLDRPQAFAAKFFVHWKLGLKIRVYVRAFDLSMKHPTKVVSSVPGFIGPLATLPRKAPVRGRNAREIKYDGKRVQLRRGDLVH
ncbi:hypothetical protein JQ633_08070 [Bradyrhizobium tropiciagri]|uniref:hypothetical protein n=1 Tax=Bradyrhizobium tropiciagri TaxID=312253 RepID=UPI001BA7B33A|nr:hypothetical protein [Bradyrhizobium tropiciagri]MBR0870308.1 hypothetical protein [Bradyrhizobium tropiciagri]